MLKALKDKLVNLPLVVKLVPILVLGLWLGILLERC